MSTIYIVEIIRAEDGTVVKSMTAHSEHQAQRIDAGVNINLNHEEYYTQIREEQED